MIRYDAMPHNTTRCHTVLPDPVRYDTIRYERPYPTLPNPTHPYPSCNPSQSGAVGCCLPIGDVLPTAASATTRCRSKSSICPLWTRGCRRRRQLRACGRSCLLPALHVPCTVAPSPPRRDARATERSGAAHSHPAHQIAHQSDQPGGIRQVTTHYLLSKAITCSLLTNANAAPTHHCAAASLTTHHSPLSNRHSPLNAHHSPLITHHSPLTTHHSPLITRHSPLTASHKEMMDGTTDYGPLTKYKCELTLGPWLTHYSQLTTHYSLNATHC